MVCSRSTETKRHALELPFSEDHRDGPYPFPQRAVVEVLHHTDNVADAVPLAVDPLEGFSDGGVLFPRLDVPPQRLHGRFV